jgi:hypothetical protein
MPQIFATTSRKEEAQAREIARLKGIIGELTVELKKRIGRVLSISEMGHILSRSLLPDHMAVTSPLKFRL